MSKMVLRYAPSPTGPQHIGGLRTALYCYLLAQKHGGEFILRIEDTDQNRFVEGAEDFIIRAAEWLGLKFTQGVHVGGPHAPYRQSERSELYGKFAQQLLDQGDAYYAFDTPEDLAEMRRILEENKVEHRTYNYVTRQSMKNSLTLPAEEVQRRIDAGEPYVVRFKVPTKEDIRFQDIIRGHMHFHSSVVDDKVLLKSDGLPTYHLANVVDDYHMEVTHVVRGEEWLPSTPLHVLLYKALGWADKMPVFAHLALLLGPNGGKLSKRNADKFGIPVFPFDWLDPASGETWRGYKDLGYLPEAVMNYISLLGWHPGTEQELMSRAELIEAFSLERCHKAGAKFDMDKLKSFQEHYLRAKSTTELAALVRPSVEAAGYEVSDTFLETAVELMRERIAFPQDLVQQGAFFFAAPTEYHEKSVRKKWKADPVAMLRELLPRFESAGEWKAETLHGIFVAFVEEKEVGMGKLMAPLRLALTGMAGGPGLFETAELVGKEETIARINAALERLPVS